MTVSGNGILGLRWPLAAATVAVASLVQVPSTAAADDDAVVLPPASYTASDCAGETPIVVASDGAAQSDLYSAVTLAGVVETDCVVLAGARGEPWSLEQRTRLAAAEPDGYVVGGLAAVPSAKVAGLSLKRLAGADRWATARLVGNEARSLAGADDGDADASAGAEDPTTDCSGDIPIVAASDAAAQSDLYSAVTLAGVVGTDCIVLAGDRDGEMPATQKTRLSSATSGGYIVGGAAAVPATKVAGRDMTRLAGADRWETAQFVGRLASGDTTVGTSTKDEAGASQPPDEEALEAFTAVSAGFEHSCGLRTDGTVTCWGSDYFDKALASSVSVEVVRQNSDGEWCGYPSHYLVQEEYNLLCWPANPDGDALPPSGSSSTLCGQQPQRSDSEACMGLDPALEFTSVSAGRGYSCGLRADRTVTCWGLNHVGQADAPSGTFSAVSAGPLHSCGVRTNGTVTCWGDNEWGESTQQPGKFIAVAAGYGHSCGVRTNGTVTCWGNNELGQSTAPSGTFISVALGRQHSCGLRTDGTVKCWGRDLWGRTSPPSGTFAALASSNGEGAHSCGLRHDGTIECWGYQHSPGFGFGIVYDAPLGNFVAVSVSNSHSCALRVDGSVACWGANGSGQTSVAQGPYVTVTLKRQGACALRTDGSVTCLGAPSPVSGEFAAVAIGGSPFSACGLRTDGTVTCWGFKLGDDDGAPEFVPSGRLSAVAVGLKHACALRADGTAVCWGDNERGQSSAPPGTFTEISAMNYNSCALRTDNTAVCWGEFEHLNGQFHTKQPSYAPAGQYASVIAGAAHACGLRHNGTVNCWGPTGSASDDPPGTFTAISVGASNNCGLRDDGSLYCWGPDYYDGLFDGFPYELTAVAVGGPHSRRRCAVLSDGWIRCWGTWSEHRIALPS